MRSLAAGLVWIVLAGVRPVAAQPAPGLGTEQQLARIAAALETLVSEGRAQAAVRTEELELRRVQVVVAVLQMRLRRIDRLEQELREKEEQEDREREQIAMMKSDLETRAEELDATAGEEQRQELQGMQRRMEPFIAQMEDRSWRTTQRKNDLANDISDERLAIASLEERLDEWLVRHERVPEAAPR